MIEVRRLNKTYDKGRRNANHALKNVSFTLPDTGFVCILGASGCGKTSLLNAIGGLDNFERGTISTENVKVNRYGTKTYENERNSNFGYIFQNYYLLLDHSVAYNVYLGLHSLDLTHNEKLKRVREALRSVEMERYIHRTVGELSGGQQQRVAIARALARRPRVIFADEPTGNLDEANTLKICSLLRRISKTSLVVMVTHEARIARFFADRIITLDSGRIKADEMEWNRSPLSSESGKTVYAGDYEEATYQSEGVRLRVLREETAEPVDLVLVVERDRVLLKLDDGRTVACGDMTQAPLLKEGKRPVLSLEEIDAEQEETVSTVQDNHDVRTKAGLGLTFPMMLQEAKRLVGGRGLKRATMRFFLMLLTVLAIVTVSDYLTVSSLDPEDFITTDSHILEIKTEYGAIIREGDSYLQNLSADYMNYLREQKDGYTLVPHVPVTATYSVNLFRQMDRLELNFGNFSYVPLEYFDESTLIYGRMPENSEEIVVDRWLLDAAAGKDGILQNSITDASYFLNRTVNYAKKNYAPKIVGICDSGEPAVYMSTAGLITIGVNGKAVMPLSELQEKYPGVYDHITMDQGQCIAVKNVAGMGYSKGSSISITTRTRYEIVEAIEADVYAAIVVADHVLEDILWDMSSDRFYLYCEDKAATKAFLAQPSSFEEEGYLVTVVRDRHQETWNAYEAATTMKTDARTIVTVTIIGLALVMLYLLCRAQIQERLEMLSVYRLLGIPRRKLAGIFVVESVLSSLTTVLPAALLTWVGITVAGMVPEWNVSLILPWQAVAVVYGFILLYYVVVSLLPLVKLLTISPAKLAAKYDL